MTEASGRHHEPINLVRTVAQSNVISRLRPSGLADYHLAVTALQCDGQDIFLSTTAGDMASEVVERTQHDLVVASGDALTKEMIPGGVGGTGRDNSIMADTLPAVSDKVRVYQGRGDYESYWPRYYKIGVQGEDRLNKDFCGLVFAMRSRLTEVRDDSVEAVQAVADIADLSSTYFGEQRRMLIKAYLPTPERGWLEFAEYLQEYIAAIRSGHGSLIAVQANRLINAVHEGRGDGGMQEPMVARFTHDWSPDADRYVEVLDATQGPYEELAHFAGYVGVLLLPYLNGTQKSLTRLPSSKPVPAAFTHLQ